MIAADSAQTAPGAAVLRAHRPPSPVPDREPPVSSCDTADPPVCTDLPPQPANFVYLHSERQHSAPYISDPFLSGESQEPDGVGTTQADDWGDKAVAGQTFLVAAVKGDWTAIWYGSQKAWLYNPDGANTVPTSSRFIKVASGKDPTPVWGAAYPSKLKSSRSATRSRGARSTP